MNNFKSIYKKLITLNLSVVIALVVVFSLFSAVAAFLIVERTFSLVEKQAHRALVAQGELLVANNALALRGMVEDNAFSAISELVETTVKNSENIEYGIYMTGERIPLVNVSDVRVRSDFGQLEHLDDEFSLWASGITSADHKVLDESVLEFAAPVFIGEEREGTIRYAFSNTTMQESVAKRKREVLLFFGYMGAVIFALSSLFIWGVFTVVQKQSHEISDPITLLTQAAEIIADGDYTEEIVIASNDEIGVLANTFERMRLKIKGYTDSLEAKVLARTMELEDAQRDALRNAHKAGMADIATSTLHNVGNILNSLKASATYIDETNKKLPVEKFQRANELLSGELGSKQPFTEPARANMLAEYYQKVTEESDRCSVQIKEHSYRVLDKINLIAQTIASQQSVAGRAPSFEESIQLSTLIESAVTLYQHEFDKSEITLKQDMSCVPPLKIDGNKVMQILVNLIKNAKEAIDQYPQSSKELMITLGQSEKEISIRIKDTGCGVPKEDRDKIFAYGYTTKVGGHGFGLHSCANFMTEMNGSIAVNSDGVGAGAEFVLSFPLAV